MTVVAQVLLFPIPDALHAHGTNTAMSAACNRCQGTRKTCTYSRDFRDFPTVKQQTKRKSPVGMHHQPVVMFLSRPRLRLFDLGSGPQMNARSIPLDSVPSEPEPDMPIQFSRKDMYRYFIKERNWLYLLGTSSTWFFLDVALCGFGLDNRIVLADMWATKHKAIVDSNLICWHSSLPGGNSAVPTWTDALPVWQTDYTEPCNTIYDVLLTQAKHYLLTVSIGSILGYAALSSWSSIFLEDNS